MIRLLDSIPTLLLLAITLAVGAILGQGIRKLAAFIQSKVIAPVEADVAKVEAAAKSVAADIKKV